MTTQPKHSLTIVQSKITLILPHSLTPGANPILPCISTPQHELNTFSQVTLSLLAAEIATAIYSPVANQSFPTPPQDFQELQKQGKDTNVL